MSLEYELTFHALLISGPFSADYKIVFMIEMRLNAFLNIHILGRADIPVAFFFFKYSFHQKYSEGAEIKTKNVVVAIMEWYVGAINDFNVNNKILCMHFNLSKEIFPADYLWPCQGRYPFRVTFSNLMMHRHIVCYILALNTLIHRSILATYIFISFPSFVKIPKIMNASVLVQSLNINEKVVDVLNKNIFTKYSVVRYMYISYDLRTGTFDLKDMFHIFWNSRHQIERQWII